MRGVVTRSTGSGYTVLLDDGQTIEAGLRGRLRLRGVRTTNPIAVGDRVVLDGGMITDIEPRRNYIIRRASNLSKESHILASNIDRAVLVATLVQPDVRTEFIDRFLVTCEAYGIPVTIVLNKTDLGAPAQEFIHTYRLAGYDVLEIAALHGEGLDTLNDLLKDRTTLIAGNSGVGKSTIIKAIIPSADVRTGEISDAHNKGRHTTTHAAMYPLPHGGYVIDTPGVKGFGLIDIAPQELARYYPEMMSRVPNCRFPNCTHTHEPGCAVRQAVESGDIATSRYISYLKTLEEDDKYRK
jgi:ribosome biogenesis GTPase